MSNLFLFEKSLDRYVPDLIKQYSHGKQTIVFCASKKNTETLCASIHTVMQQFNAFRGSGGVQNERSSSGNGSVNQDEIQYLIGHLTDPRLRVFVQGKTAYHHAGLPPDDRSAVERLFLLGHIITLCSTSTLAHGINLPAHLVVIKGTNQWRGGSKGYERMPKSTVLQMVGRAGRPGFDSFGVAVVMTSQEDKLHFQDVSVSAEVVESALQGALVEVICAEITQTVITSISEALEWLKNTFFYIRVHRNPMKYGFESAKTSADLEHMLKEYCM
eukprot:gene14273-30372_t